MTALHATDCADVRVQQEGGSSGPPTPGQMKEFWAQVQNGRIDKNRMQAILQSDVRTEWEDFYGRVLGMGVGFSHLALPAPKPGFNKVLIIAHGLQLSRLLHACEERFPVRCYWDNTDSAISRNERDSATGSYAIRVRDRVEADEELKNLSAEDIAEREIATETALERVIHELKYNDEKGGHLDVKSITLCSGSRVSDGHVPSVDWFGGALSLHWHYPQGAGARLRARAVVS
ncbi:hypothetical protein BK004_02005 [bacterium CG10_46_32]|nr:MAG: hypothetical protein BK004_02005 [bacterium CG10_46_32]PIR56208.1 MAG: hypothetical protein COU73_02030 [Parcubacteria group bacterium CG10_big_fil_rev_8_21_14_0_10_46_32]